MYCVCNDEGKAQAEELLQFVYQTLDCDATNLLSAVVYSLEWDYNALIRHMYCDQWAAVIGESQEVDDKNEPLYKIRIECDMLEHGVAGVWKYFFETLDERHVPTVEIIE